LPAFTILYFRQNLKFYPLKTGACQGNCKNTNGIGIKSLVPEDDSAFEMLNKIIRHEPKELFGAGQSSRLATLGIVKGQPFCPGEHMKGILDQAAKLG
jgi:hypothetical protein